MIRSFELQIYNDQMFLVDKFPLELTTDPSGLGYKQDITILATGTFDYITKQQLKKQSIKLKAHFPEPYSYDKVNEFRNWTGKHLKNKMVLYYNDTSHEKWIDIAIEDFGITEIDTRLNTVSLTFKALSPFYEITERKIILTHYTVGKVYSFSYPYTYGGGKIYNRTFNNTFFEEIPLIVQLYGKIVNPTFSLRNEKEIYTTVRFNNFTIEEGQILEINAVTSRILLYRDAEDPNPIDMFNSVDKTHDTFALAAPGFNEIIINLDQNERSAKGIVSYTQFIV